MLLGGLGVIFAVTWRTYKVSKEKRARRRSRRALRRRQTGESEVELEDEEREDLSGLSTWQRMKKAGSNTLLRDSSARVAARRGRAE